MCVTASFKAQTITFSTNVKAPQLTCSALCFTLLQMNPSVYLHLCAESLGNTEWSRCAPCICMAVSLRNHSHWGVKSHREIPAHPSSLEGALWVYLVRVIWKLGAKHNCFFLKSHLADAQHSAADISNISCYLDSSRIAWIGLRIDQDSGGPDVCNILHSW